MININNSMLYIISIIHIIIIILILTIPFTDSNYLLSLYFITIPFIMLHWIINDNTCCLTFAEKYFREKTYNKTVNIEDCISYKIIAPIYDFNKNNNDFSTFIYALTFSLWSIASYKLYNKYETGQIKNIIDLFKLSA
jgi:hypothetical protein